MEKFQRFLNKAWKIGVDIIIQLRKAWKEIKIEFGKMGDEFERLSRDLEKQFPEPRRESFSEKASLKIRRRITRRKTRTTRRASLSKRASLRTRRRPRRIGRVKYRKEETYDPLGLENFSGPETDMFDDRLKF